MNRYFPAIFNGLTNEPNFVALKFQYFFKFLFRYVYGEDYYNDF